MHRKRKYASWGVVDWIAVRVMVCEESVHNNIGKRKKESHDYRMDLDG
jgi:hypothetical protein